MYYTGQISLLRKRSITSKEGITRPNKEWDWDEPKFLLRTKQTPGCKGDFPVISPIEVPFSVDESRTKKLIVFCGSDNGRHNTLRFYDRLGPVFSPIDFYDGPVDVKEDESGIYFTITHKEYFKSIESTIHYPFVYRLILPRYWQNPLNVVETSKSRELYRNLLETENKSSDDMTYFLRSLIFLTLSRDKENYCKQFRQQSINKNKLQAIQEDLEINLGNKLEKSFLYNCLASSHIQDEKYTQGGITYEEYVDGVTVTDEEEEIYWQTRREVGYPEAVGYTEKYTQDGVTYKYEKRPHYVWEGERMRRTGGISILDKEGELILEYFNNLTPGCGPGFPAIRSIEVPTVQDESKKVNFILFCGHPGGRNLTLQFYKPGFGFVSSIGFHDGPVYLGENESGVYIVIHHKEYFWSISGLDATGRVSSPVVYKLTTNGLNIETSVDYSEKTKGVYRRYLETENEYTNDDITYFVRSLILLTLSRDKEGYCEKIGQSSIKKDKLQAIQEELEVHLGSKAGKNFIYKCEEK